MSHIRGHKSNKNSSYFLKLLGPPRMSAIPALFGWISPKKLVLQGFLEGHTKPLAHPFAWKNPTRPKVSGLKVGLCAPFLA